MMLTHGLLDGLWFSQSPLMRHQVTLEEYLKELLMEHMETDFKRLDNIEELLAEDQLLSIEKDLQAEGRLNAQS